MGIKPKYQNLSSNWQKIDNNTLIGLLVMIVVLGSSGCAGLRTNYKGKIVTVGPDQQYQQIQPAVNSIKDASAEKPYVVLVYPGRYEERVTLKPYISLVGTNKEQCIISKEVTQQGYWENALLRMPNEGIDTAVLAHLTIENHHRNYPSIALYFSGWINDCILKSYENDTAVVGGLISNCQIIGGNDTVNLYNFAIVKDCHIEDIDARHPGTFFIGNAGQFYIVNNSLKSPNDALRLATDGATIYFFNNQIEGLAANRPFTFGAYKVKGFFLHSEAGLTSSQVPSQCTNLTAASPEYKSVLNFIDKKIEEYHRQFLN